MTIRSTIFLLLVTVSNSVFSQIKPQSVNRNDFKQYYDRFGVQGSFVLFDPQSNTYTFYNQPQIEKAFIPASTFKICNTLIGLETGVIKDEMFVIPWDGIKRQNEAWNQNQDLESAFKNSTVWYYQELARRVGPKKMKLWIDKAAYGNADTTGGIDRFWLSGGLRISPWQQIEFLAKLRDNKLPFSERSMEITKSIMIVKATPDYVLRAKTGWGSQDKLEVGWYVGYLEIKGKVWYFANCIQTPGPGNENFGEARTEIVSLILDDLGLLKK